MLSGLPRSLVDDAMVQGGLSQAELSITTAILCRPPGGHMLPYTAELKRAHDKRCKEIKAKAPKKKKGEPGIKLPEFITPQDCCAPRLARDIADSGAKVITSLGSESLKAVAHYLDLPYAGAKAEAGKSRVATLKKQHGSPVIAADGRVLLASLHPGFTIYGNPTFVPIMRADLQRAATIAKRGGSINWTRPEFIIKPSIDTIRNVLRAMIDSKALVTVDIETDGIIVTQSRVRCIGLGAVIDGKEVIIVVPLRHMNGQPWWLHNTELEVVRMLRELLDIAPLSGHNLLFDTGVCLSQDLMRDRLKTWFDCYLDSETEFLTERGWLQYDDVTASDQLATVASDGTMQWQPYQLRVDKQRTGAMYEVETKHTRAVITPKHTIWSRPVVRGSAARRGEWSLTPAEQLLSKSPDSGDVLRACHAEPDGATTVTQDNIQLDATLLKYLGVAISDGTIRLHKEKPYRIIVSQMQDGRAYKLLQEVQQPLELKFYSYEKNEEWRSHICIETRWVHPDKEVAAAFVQWFGRKSVDRSLPSWVFRLPANLRRALFDGLILGDASEVEVMTVYRSMSKRLVDGVQALALSLGVPATVARDGECWCVNMRRDLPPEVEIRMRDREQDQNGSFQKRPEATSRVVCFVVPNHTLVTRSGGRPAFYGNTMVGHHNTDHSELPHDLGFVAGRAFEAPRWKDDADHKSVSNVDDYTLHYYCGCDVLGEMRLVPYILSKLEDTGFESYITDMELAPAARDMGILGLNINETRRMDMFHKLNSASKARAAEVKSIVGRDDFNPNAFKQVSKYLYLEKKLSPPFATDGSEWAELANNDEIDIDLEDPETIVAMASTNEMSLLRLLDLGVDEQTRKFIDSLLWYRGLEKCKGTYIGFKYDTDTGELVDTHRKKGNILTESHGSHKNLSILHPNWKIHITPCVTLDTWVLTGDGPRQIGAIPGFGTDKTSVPASAQFTLNDGQCNQVVSHFVNSGMCDAYTIETTLGLKLTGTPHHRVVFGSNLIKGKMFKVGPRRPDGTRPTIPIEPVEAWRRLDEVQINEYLKVPFGMNTWGQRIPTLQVREFVPQGNRFKTGLHVPTNVTLDLALFAGMYTADGSLHNSNGSFAIRISNSKKEVQQEVKQVMTRLFGDEHVHQDSDTTYVTSVALATWAQDVGFGRRIENKKAPEWLLSCPWEYIATYIKGCALDSNVNLIDEITPIWTYTGTEQLAREMQMLLLNRGIVAAVSDRRAPESPQRWACVVTGQHDVDLICAITGQTASVPQRSGDRHRPRYVRRGNVLWLKVESVVKETMQHLMRDVTIPETHAFWSGGFVSHNTGRWSTSPAVQNWPERVVYDVELYHKAQAQIATLDEKNPAHKAQIYLLSQQGIINTRSMVEAPGTPGSDDEHVLVGADYAAIELRLYAIQANDTMLLQAIYPDSGRKEDELDPHALNFASMMSARPGDLMEWYKRIQALPKNVKKYKRLIAKRFCIAEGSLVLTPRGLVPIEQILNSDLLWDGVEWVSHDGVVYQGIKEVIEHDGLSATADHEVWTQDGRKSQLGEASSRGDLLARTGEGRNALRFVEDNITCLERWTLSLRRSGMFEVQDTAESVLGQSDVRQNKVMSKVLLRQGRIADVAVRSNECSKSALHESELCKLGGLRQTRNSVQVRVSSCCDGMGAETLESRQVTSDGQDRQQRSLRAWEHSLRDQSNEQHESTMHEAARVVDLQTGRVALQRETCLQVATIGSDERASASASASGSQGKEKDVATNRRMVRVYDIINAGPRRRFTVSGQLVSNCFLVIYGGQLDKLYRTMSADRNPDGSRSFPDLKPGDCEMWWNNWHQFHPQTQKWQKMTVHNWQSHGFVTTILDHRKRFFIGGLDVTAIPNHTIQGEAGSIMNRGMKRIVKECPYRGWSAMSGPILQVHDFGGLQVPKKRQKEAEELLASAMPYMHKGHAIDIEGKSGRSWDLI